MKIAITESKGIILSQFCITLLLFFIPISATAKSILFIVTIMLLVAMPYFNRHIVEHCKSFIGLSAGLFFFYIVLSCCWSPAPVSAQFNLVSKYCKLIYIPILAVGFIHQKTRIWALNAYLMAMVVTCIVSFLKFKGFLVANDPGEVFYNHIITGFMVAFASYIAAYWSLESKGWLRVFYIGITLLTTYQVLFINTGRTGYIVYFFLMIVLLLVRLPAKASLIGIVVFSTAFVLAYNQSPIMQTGVKNCIAEIQSLRQNNKNTSLGFRLQFHDYAKTLFLEHPLIGIGTAGFQYQFYQDNPVPAWGREITDPHSQYWMTLSEQGLIGFFLLVVFLVSIYLTSLRLDKTKPLLLGILISFSIGSLTDSILCYSTVGYLLTIMCALCLGELLEERIKKGSLETENQPILADQAAG